MAFGGDVDTLNLLFDKLQYIFSGYGTIRDSFLEVNSLYKQGKISNKEFFEKIHESINRFSALEFLLVKAMFEIKKTLDKSSSKPGKPATPTMNQTSSNSLASFIMAKNLPSHDVNVFEGDVKTCARCSMVMKKISKFCTNCGNKVQ